MLYSTACQLVSPKHVCPGTLRITPSQLHFSGELPVEDGPMDKGRVSHCLLSVHTPAKLQTLALPVKCLCCSQIAVAQSAKTAFVFLMENSEE